MTIARLVPLVGLVAVTGVIASQITAAKPTPRDVVSAASLFVRAPMATIAKDGLRVTVALPDARRGFYRSTRFDWSGMITEATIGNARFYGPWFDGVASNVRDVVDTASGVIVGPRNAATGPAEECASRDGETVPGYNAAPVGGSFIKIGVGRLRKADAQPYDHFRAYDIADPGVWRIRRSAERIAFRQRLAADETGYGYVYEKTLTLTAGGAMTISHWLRNIGTKPIARQIYTHNFARFDDAGIGPGIAIAFPFAPVGPVSNPAQATITGRELRYLQPLQPGDRLQLPPQPGGPTVPSGPFRVTGANGASITMQADAPLVRTAVWSMRRTVAVEPFVRIDIAPGETQKWSWRYSYATGS